MRIHSFHNDLYRFDLHVIVGGTCKQSVSRFNRKFKMDLTDLDGCAGYHSGTTIKGNSTSVIWIRDDPQSEMVDIVAHESFHCAVHHLSNAGVRFSRSSEEAYAYLIGWVGRRVWEAKLAA